MQYIDQREINSYLSGPAAYESGDLILHFAGISDDKGGHMRKFTDQVLQRSAVNLLEESARSHSSLPASRKDLFLQIASDVQRRWGDNA